VRNSLIIQNLLHERPQEYTGKPEAIREFKRTEIGVSGCYQWARLKCRQGDASGECQIHVAILRSYMDAVAIGLEMTQSLANTPPILCPNVGGTKLGDLGFGHRYPRPNSDRWATAIIVRGNIVVGVGGGEASIGSLYVDPLKLAGRIDRYLAIPPRLRGRANQEPAKMKIAVLKPDEANKEPSEAGASRIEAITYLVNDPYRVHLDFTQPKDTPLEIRLYVDNAAIWEDAKRQIWITPRATPNLRIHAYALDEVGGCIASGEHQITTVRDRYQNDAIPKSQR